jgi:N-methylhydantoinase B
MGGTSQHGNFDATATFDANGGGTGATLTEDGDDTAAFILAPGAMMADVESYESRFPLMYMFRRKRENSGGYGQFQGGLGGEAGVMIHGTDNWKVGFRTIGRKVAATTGIFGGYPANSSVNGYVRRDGNSARLSIEERNRMLNVADLLGHPGIEVTEPIIRSKALADGDIYFQCWSGGGGLGDPLQRDPQLVLQDVIDRKITREAANQIYGVVLAGTVVDLAATQRLRQDIIAARKAEATVQPPGATTQKHFCLNCDTEQESRAYRDRRASDVLHPWVDDEWMTYREFFCPQCWSLIHVGAIGHDRPPDAGKR